MNASQRKTLRALQTQVDGFLDTPLMVGISERIKPSLLPAEEKTLLLFRQRAANDLGEIKNGVESAADEENDKFEDMSDGQQNGSKGANMRAGIECLNSAVDALGDAVSVLNRISYDEDDAESLQQHLDEASDMIGEAL